MTVEQLIAQLSGVRNQSRTVYLCASGYERASHIFPDEDGDIVIISESAEEAVAAEREADR